MITFSVEELVSEMKQHHNSKRTNYEKIALAYRNFVYEKVMLTFVRGTGEYDANGNMMLYISYDELRDNCDRYRKDGKTYYWFDWLNSIKCKNRLFVELQKGDNWRGKMTHVKTTFDLDLALASRTDEECVQTIYEGTDTNLNSIDVPVDMQSLSNYIKSTEAIVNKTDTHTRNLRHAKIFYRIATYFDGHIPHFEKESEFGRKYYTGLSLQNVHKLVRSAVLGDCYEYDLDASVYRWKYHVCKDYGISMPATLEYLDKKDTFREHIARIAFGNTSETSIKTAKAVINAIGFGAKASSTGYRDSDGKFVVSSLRDLITSKTALDRVLTDIWVSEFVAEQDAFNKAVFAYTLNGTTHEDIIKRMPFLATDKGDKVCPKRLVAYLYQQTERQTIDQLISIAQPAQPLIVVHDAFYTKRKAKLLELREVCANEGVKIKETEHKGYTFVDFNDISEHKQRINEQERLANGYEGFAKSVKFEYTPPSTVDILIAQEQARKEMQEYLADSEEGVFMNDHVWQQIRNNNRE